MTPATSIQMREARQTRSLANELAPLLRIRLLQLGVLTALLVLVGAVAFQLKLSVIDLDVWWHLKVGDWIFLHAGFPHNGILSRSAATRSWAAYSWGYEVLLSRSYAWFGLLGIGLYGTLLTLMVAFSVYWMVRRLSGRFWFSCLLTFTCCYAFLFLMMPRPVFFSAALFCVTLTLLLESSRAGRVETLYWLPLIFLLWANLHIQFIYGLAAVGLFVAANVVQEAGSRLGIPSTFVETAKLPTVRLAAVFGGCVLATLIGPYSYHLYGVVFAYSRSQFIYSMIKELQPLSFRGYENWVELLLAGAAFFAVAWQTKINLFKLGLLLLASVMAFHTMRDSWFLCVAAAACIADSYSNPAKEEQRDTPFELAGVFAVVAIVLLLFARGLDFNDRGLDRAVSTFFPVNAVNFVRRAAVPGPLYNNFDWGGFLTWYMPDYPVVIDGRTDLYGDKLDQQMIETQNGEPSYKANPYLNDAGLVLLRQSDGLVPVLQSDARFQKVYDDPIAAVFARR